MGAVVIVVRHRMMLCTVKKYIKSVNKFLNNINVGIKYHYKVLNYLVINICLNVDALFLSILIM